MDTSATRTSIVIDDRLMQRALEASGLKTKRAAVEAGLRLLVRLSRQADVRAWFGKLRWEGDLQQMRRDESYLGLVRA